MILQQIANLQQYGTEASKAAEAGARLGASFDAASSHASQLNTTIGSLNSSLDA